MEFGSDWGGEDYYDKPKKKIREKPEEKIENRPKEGKEYKSEEELKRKELEEQIKEEDEEKKQKSKEYLEKLKEKAEEKKKLKEEEESQKRKEIEERITKDEKDDRHQEELNDKDKKKVNDETKDIESEKIKEKIDGKEKKEVHEGITKKEIEEYRKETIEVFGDFKLQMYLEEFSIDKKISANKGTEIRPEFKEYIEKLDDGVIDPYRESLLEKCDLINKKHLFDKFLIDVLYNKDNPLEFISDYEKHTGLEISFGTIEKIAKENNIEIKIFAEPIYKDIDETEISENQILRKENRELKEEFLDLREREQEYCNKIYNLEKEKAQLEEKISELEREKKPKELSKPSRKEKSAKDYDTRVKEEKTEKRKMTDRELYTENGENAGVKIKRIKNLQEPIEINQLQGEEEKIVENKELSEKRKVQEKTEQKKIEVKEKKTNISNEQYDNEVQLENKNQIPKEKCKQSEQFKEIYSDINKEDVDFKELTQSDIDFFRFKKLYDNLMVLKDKDPNNYEEILKSFPEMEIEIFGVSRKFKGERVITALAKKQFVDMFCAALANKLGKGKIKNQDIKKELGFDLNRNLNSDQDFSDNTLKIFKNYKFDRDFHVMLNDAIKILKKAQNESKFIVSYREYEPSIELEFIKKLHRIAIDIVGYISITNLEKELNYRITRTLKIKSQLSNHTIEEKIKRFIDEKIIDEKNKGKVQEALKEYLIEKKKIRENLIEKSPISAEFISILLGDGCLSNDGYEIQVALNAVDDKEYVKYVKEKILVKLFPDSHIGKYRTKDANKKGISLKIHSVVINKAVLALGKGINKTGLVKGNKVKNQVSVPDWIYPEYRILSHVIGGTKGLFDTDGSISVHKGQLVLNFSNKSIPLVYDFYNMCNVLDINPIEPRESNKKKNAWSVEIYASRQVKRFLDIIQPEKFKESTRRTWLGLNLIYQKAPEKIMNAVDKKISQWKKLNNRKIFNYTVKNKDLLKKWVEKELKKNDINKVYGYNFTGEISKEMTASVINNALIEWRDVQFFWDEKENKYIIRQFPKIVRNLIIDNICNTLKRKENTANLEFLIQIQIKDLINSQGYIGKINPLNESMHDLALTDYYHSLIMVSKEVFRRSLLPSLKEKISYYYIIQHFKNLGIKLAFGRRATENIVRYLQQKYHIP